jgi:hypothetical protein
MQYFLQMRRTSFEENRASAGRAARRLAALRLGSWHRSSRKLPHIGRMLHAIAPAARLWWAATTRHVRLKWSDFRSLSSLEQGCWALLAVVSALCITLRILRPWGF